MPVDEIVLPSTSPETEWILGKPVRKVSSFRTHARLQGALLLALTPWAEGRGEVAPEWRFRIAPPGEARRPLVPDLAFVRTQRLRDLTDEEIEAPPLAPDVATEILSPGDNPAHVAHKIGIYLAAGSLLVLVVDPRDRNVTLHDAGGSRTLRVGDTIAHAALPGFVLPLATLFAALARPR